MTVAPCGVRKRSAVRANGLCGRRREFAESLPDLAEFSEPRPIIVPDPVDDAAAHRQGRLAGRTDAQDEAAHEEAR